MIKFTYKIGNIMLKYKTCLLVATLINISAVWADEVIVITTHGEPAYYIGEKVNPNLTLKRGVTYQIQMNAPGHPLWIKTTIGTGTADTFNKGVTGNGKDRGTIMFIVPADAPDRLIYNCQFHVVMHGLINITD